MAMTAAERLRNWKERKTASNKCEHCGQRPRAKRKDGSGYIKTCRTCAKEATERVKRSRS